jgi:hypothetical protein
MNQLIESMKTTTTRRRVRFAPTSQVVFFPADLTKGIEDKLWYSEDDIIHFKLFSTIYGELVRERLSDGSFRGDFGDLLGLEKYIFSHIYHDRRALLKSAVLKGQKSQRQRRLSQEIMQKRGHPLTDDVLTVNIGITRLANIAEKNSRWAKERAAVAALVLESDLKTAKTKKDGRRPKHEALASRRPSRASCNLTTQEDSPPKTAVSCI